MQGMTLEQLRSVSRSGGISQVTLKAKGGMFLVKIDTRSGSPAVLAKARSNEPRQFGNPTAALNVLRAIGITVGQFDASEWDPSAKQPTAGRRGRAEALRNAHKASAHASWLNAEIQSTIDDPRANVGHDEVLAEMDADIARLEEKAARRKRT